MKVVFVVGPTASGKSELAMKCARRFHGEIVNADSLQVYKSLDVGTAKPPEEERREIRHHLFDFVEEGKIFTAGDYRQAALEVLRESDQRGIRCLFFVGGSGFYIQALLKGMYRLPKPNAEVKERVKKEIDEKGGEEAYRILRKLDPSYAERVSVNDLYRVGRGLEIIYSTGKKVSDVVADFSRKGSDEFSYGYSIFGLDAERADLRRRVSERAEKMLQSGWIEEVRALRNRGWGDWPPMRSVGYREVQAFLDGDLDRENLLEKIVTSTMQLAKKQRTWFKHKLSVQWFDLAEAGLAERAIESFIEGNGRRS